MSKSTIEGLKERSSILGRTMVIAGAVAMLVGCAATSDDDAKEETESTAETGEQAFTTYSGSPFAYASANDERAACLAMSLPGLSSLCDGIRDPNQRQLCRAMSQHSQAPCWSITNRDLQLACFGMSIDWSSNCRDIVNPNMRAFCRGVSSNDYTQCAGITDRSTQLLCYAMSNGISSNCRDIASVNDRNFCYGVSAHSLSQCWSIR